MSHVSFLLFSLICYEAPSRSKVENAIDQLLRQETNIDRLMAFQRFLNRPSASPLVEAVILADKEAKAAWLDALTDDFMMQHGNAFADSFNSDDVQCMTLGEGNTTLNIYSCGGMSNGSSPSNTFDLWLEVLSSDGNTIAESNPYAEDLRYLLFISPSKPFLPSTSIRQRYFHGAEIVSREPVIAPF